MTVTANVSRCTNVFVSSDALLVHAGSDDCAALAASTLHTLSGLGLRTQTGGSFVPVVSLFHVSDALLVSFLWSTAQSAFGAFLTMPPMYSLTLRPAVPSAVLVRKTLFAVAVVVCFAVSMAMSKFAVSSSPSTYTRTWSLWPQSIHWLLAVQSSWML